MGYRLAMRGGTLHLPHQLLKDAGLEADTVVTVHPENGGLRISAIKHVTEEPTFLRGEPPPLNLDDLVTETDEEHLAEGFSALGLMTREQFMTALRTFEDAHGMSSVEFYDKWQRGEMPNEVEFSIWAAMYECSLRDVPFLGEVPLEDIVGERE